MATSWVVLYCVLWAAVLVLAVLVLGLSKRTQQLSSLIRANRSRAADVGGPEVGSIFPLIPGDVHPVGSSRRVILFLVSSCAPCRKLAQSVTFAPGPRGSAGRGFELLLVTDAQGAKDFAGIGASLVFVENKREVSENLRIKATPFGIAVDRFGTVRGTTVPHSWADVVSLADKCTAGDASSAPAVIGSPLSN